ncbi:hypothetical protein SLS60_008006 [Paraconiothyrium brasiliense]|uniref:Uncharacterized protein n=1 Tax=Paraconiothyrium brasiliense TaxID=300254 RepID=A0ABR3R3M4_9PLEO
MAWIPIAAAIAAFGSTALATASTKCPVPDLCFSLEIPDLTLASATGDIFLSITGPTTYASITLTHSNWLSREQDHFHVTLNPENSNVEITRFSVNDMRGYYVAAIERLPGCGLSDGKANAKMRCKSRMANPVGAGADIRQAQRAIRGAADPWK